MTGKIIETYKDRIESLTLIPSDGGRFEIAADGEQLYSKLASGEFPDEDRLVRQIGDRISRSR